MKSDFTISSFFRQPSMKIQDMLLRFPHLPEKIFQKLDIESLFKSREVARSWQNVIDGRNYKWLRIVNIPTILQSLNSYFHLAAETGQIQAFKTALHEEEGKYIKNELGKRWAKRSLHLAYLQACDKGHSNVVKILIENSSALSIDLNTKDADNWTGFIRACDMGHSNVVKILMENSAALSINLNRKDSGGWTGFHWACNQGHADVVKILMNNSLNKKIYKSIKNERGETAFHLACKNGHLETVQFLLKTPEIDINAKTIYGNTAFYYACLFGHSDVVNVFMKNAAVLNIHLNAENVYLRTAFLATCQRGHLEVVKIFMEYASTLRIDLKAKSKDGNTAFNIACKVVNIYFLRNKLYGS